METYKYIHTHDRSTIHHFIRFQRSIYSFANSFFFISMVYREIVLHSIQHRYIRILVCFTFLMILHYLVWYFLHCIWFFPPFFVFLFMNWFSIVFFIIISPFASMLIDNFYFLFSNLFSGVKNVLVLLLLLCGLIVYKNAIKRLHFFHFTVLFPMLDLSLYYRRISPTSASQISCVVSNDTVFGDL